ASVVELSHVGKRLALSGRFVRPDPGVSSLWALKDVTFSVDAGSAFGVIGRNGAGKTTLLNIIAGIMQPDEGGARIEGRVMGLFNLGAGFQDELSGRENIYLNAAILGAGREEVDCCMAAILEFCELGEFIDMPLGSYSQGMRLRLGFSVIASLDFDVLVLDEVLAVGDALFQDKCFRRLADLNRQGKTLILTTQDLGLIERFCDTVVLLDHGSLVFHGAPADAVNRYRALLSAERFYVGPVPRTKTLVENTKKWADDISLWGSRRGTREVTIDRFQFLNRWGWPVSSCCSSQALSVSVRFSANTPVRDPHFGIAFFRDDGAYCWGPNTLFDGCRIPYLPRGKGSFTLVIRRMLLAPGFYKISVAIWDAAESVPYDYHEGCYEIRVTGAVDPDRPLLNMPFYFSDLHATCGPDKILTMIDDHGKEKDSFYTGQPVTAVIQGTDNRDDAGARAPCIAIYRDDGVCCQKMTCNASGPRKCFFFPRLLLLPGKYELRYGSARYPFKMVFDRFDHGTVSMEHSWKWKIDR
ncbi:MAG TPA: ABC transporter ATP-binding protein, partial [Candidatus Omnitrophota bacterium]|nr:ABC transporter ATP-binding protein [Candidatus Omnitrophota bacterium]